MNNIVFLEFIALYFILYVSLTLAMCVYVIIESIKQKKSPNAVTLELAEEIVSWVNDTPYGRWKNSLKNK